MPAPPDRKGGRRLRAATGGLNTPSDHIHRSAEGRNRVGPAPDGRLGDGDTGGRVVDLDQERTRRRSTPWPGWWGQAGEMPSWTWAERSRGCRAC
jgi:hypothetical protein